MGILIVVIILAGLFYYFVMVKNGNMSFWKKAAKKPDFVYEKILKDSAWIIDDGNSEIDKDKFNGPFFLYVPSVGKTVKFYCEFDKIEASQKRIEELL